MAPLANFGDKKSLFDFVVLKGNGVKGMVDSGLSEVPEYYIQPPEERIEKAKAGVLDCPAIDLSELDGPNHDQVVDKIARAAETLGFFQVVNHGVPADVLDGLKAAAHDFFGQPTEKKAVYLKGVSPNPNVTYGTSFMPQKETTLEWRDYIRLMCTSEDDALQYWPNECKKVSLEYRKTSMIMVKKLLKALIGKLGVTLDDLKLESIIGYQMVVMNLYPACPDPDKTIGIGNHSDIGTLTLLLQDEISGLFVKLEDDIGDKKKGEWVEIPPIPNALVIIVGDVLQILSNGRYKSVEHKVRTTSAKSRVSVPIFFSPKETEKVGPLVEVLESDGVARYREFLFQDYKNNNFGNPHNGKKPLESAMISSP